MKYVRLHTTNPYYNLAVEEYLFRNAEDDVFMLWQNEPSVICGKNQNVYAEADLDYARRHGIHLCRRITGGGAVYHDLGNLNYSYISTKGDKQALDFAVFSEPIRRAIEALGVPCHMSERNDIECEGGKFSGNAQHAEDGRILHHGTLLFDTSFDEMEAVLRVDKEKLAYKAVKSLRARVVNLSSMMKEKISVCDFISRIEESVCRDLSLTPWELPKSEEIALIFARNSSNEWIFSDKRYLTSYTLQRKKKFPYGLVSIELSLENGCISGINISGDFFGTKPITALEKALIGQDPLALAPIDPSPYIGGMSFSDLEELLK